MMTRQSETVLDESVAEPSATNVRLVGRLVRIASAMGREPAEPDDVRRLLAIRRAEAAAAGRSDTAASPSVGE